MAGSPPARPSRRMVVAASAAGAAALAACGGSEDAGTPSAGTPGEELTPVSDVPEGGGVVLTDRRVVVTQPEAGTYRAFSAVCTHQGCVVADVAGGTINCACHGSRFDVTDGAVVQGPATEALPEEPIAVEGGTVRRA